MKRRLLAVFEFIRTYIAVFKQNNIMLESAALTFVTLMGIIPFTMFILMLVPEMISAQAHEAIRKALIDIFVPESAEQIQQYILQLISRKVPLNLFSIALIFVSSFSLFRIINLAFDRILNVHELRVKNFFGQIAKFFGTVVFGFLLIFILFSASSLPFVSTLFEVPFLQPITVYIIPFLLLLLLVMLGYFFIPNVRIAPRSMLMGACAAAGAWIVVKLLYNWYITNLTNMDVLYGVLSSLPVFLFWIYINWVIVLGGVALVAIIEKRATANESGGRDHLIRITFEKEVNDDTLSVSRGAMSASELRQMLEDLLKENPHDLA